jgi:Tfp pilus assembly protein PilF
MRHILPLPTRGPQNELQQNPSEVAAPEDHIHVGDPSIDSSVQVQEPVGSSSQAVWIFLSLLACALLFYFVVSLWYLWLRPNPQFLGFITGIAGLAGLSSLLSLQTRWGGRIAVQAARALGIEGWSKQPWKIFLSVASATMVLGLFLYMGSPIASQYFNQRGLEAFEAGRYSQSIHLFRQAISLSDKNSDAHFNLGSTYEYFRDFEQAAMQYRISLEINHNFWPVYNNLGRLYLSVFKDPDSALLLMLSGQTMVPDKLGQAVLHKNLGWAYLEKNLPNAALMMLQEAGQELKEISLEEKNVTAYLAETYRITALAHERLEKFDAAQQAWQDSRGYALAVIQSAACTSSNNLRSDYNCANAYFWSLEAQERLNLTHE